MIAIRIRQKLTSGDRACGDESCARGNGTASEQHAVEKDEGEVARASTSSNIHNRRLTAAHIGAVQRV